MSAEVYLAVGYALFLVITAGALDRMARHSHSRSDRYRTAGFEYDNRLDAWTCPQGEHLQRVGVDHELRLARYQARARVCNACPAKGGCTDSDTGRELARALDPWPHSEAGRFHRGIAVAMIGLAALILTIATVRNHEPSELALLVPALGIVTAILARAMGVFRAMPSGFPAGASE
jgi:hypothetical protein